MLFLLYMVCTQEGAVYCLYTGECYIERESISFVRRRMLYIVFTWECAVCNLYTGGIYIWG